jgi:hypothetical protein
MKNSGCAHERKTGRDRDEANLVAVGVVDEDIGSANPYDRPAITATPAVVRSRERGGSREHRT